MIIVVGESAILEGSILDRIAEDIDVVFIFEDGFDTFCHPDVNGSIGDHPCIATCA